jgi:hypothetical protein
VVDKKRIIRKNGGLRKRRGTRGHWPKIWKRIPDATFGKSSIILNIELPCPSAEYGANGSWDRIPRILRQRIEVSWAQYFVIF